MVCERCKALFAQRFSFWEHLSEEERNLLCENTNEASYKKGQTVHSGGDDCLGILLVRSGQLRVYMLSDEGREITLYRLFAGDTCILAASCVLNAITFDVAIDAEEDTELYQINAAAFRTLSEHNVYAENFGLQIVSARFSDVMWAMQQILFMSFDRRLAIFLIDEVAKTGEDTIHLTHEQIAKYMGSAREVVTRMLKYFAGESLVELSRGGVKILDKKRLRELI